METPVFFKSAVYPLEVGWLLEALPKKIDLGCFWGVQNASYSGGNLFFLTFAVPAPASRRWQAKGEDAVQRLLFVVVCCLSDHVRCVAQRAPHPWTVGCRCWLAEDRDGWRSCANLSLVSPADWLRAVGAHASSQGSWVAQAMRSSRCMLV